MPGKMSTDDQRFWQKVTKSAGCWIWNACKDGAGYGRFTVRRGLTTGAHRVSWVLANGEIPDGLHVLHRCDVPACVRPDHLFIGTNADNVADMMSKGRAWRGVQPSGDAHWTHVHPERVRRGEANGLTKLTAARVAKIRSDRKDGMTYDQIAIRHSISKSHVSRIVKRMTWAHVD